MPGYNFLISVPAILGIVVLALLILLFFKTNNFVFRFGIIIFLSSYFVISNWIFKKINQIFGASKAKVLVYVYASEESLKKVEPKEKKSKIQLLMLLDAQ